ncbi:MAG: tyrosine-protein phosphatase [Clostridia bacterium]|nr:tyrosine-protein phosphatase [Clostridia bacterium]MBR1686120.1 tyrosine-protein phosphatase [Clostridia bacterium]
MASLFASTHNTRFLPGSGERLIRSDAPLHLTGDEIRWLRARGVTTLVDLRSEAEATAQPCCLEGVPGFTCLHMPVTGGNRVPQSVEDVVDGYLRMVDDSMERIVETILGAKTGVMYFCAVGKDRTGMVSAMLMRRLGRPDEEIVRDYMASGENLQTVLEDYAKAHPEVTLEVMLPCEEKIRVVLCKI